MIDDEYDQMEQPERLLNEYANKENLIIEIIKLDYVKNNVNFKNNLIATFNNSKIDLVLLDYNFLGQKSKEINREILPKWSEIAQIISNHSVPIVIMSNYIDEAKRKVTTLVNYYGVTGLVEKEDMQTELEPVLDRLFKNKKKRSQGYSWIHLSDLHINCDCTEEEKSRRDKIFMDALIKDLLEFKGKGILPSAIVISGDMVINGAQAEFEIFAEYLERIREAFSISKNNIIVVPGNHDIDRSKITDIMKASCKDKTTMLSEYKLHKEEWFIKFDNYNAFFNKLKMTDFDIAPSIETCYSYTKIFDFNKKKIGFLALNSAVNSGSHINSDTNKTDDFGYLFLTAQQYGDRFLNSLKECDLKIACIHHPLNYFATENNGKVKQFLLDNFQILMQGHNHMPNVESSGYMQKELIVLPAGALYPDPADLKKQMNIMNSYTINIYDFERKNLKVFFRRYSDRLGKWIKDLDATGEEYDGEFDRVLR